MSDGTDGGLGDRSPEMTPVPNGRSRLLRMLRRLEWPLVATLAVLALGLGVVGFARYAQTDPAGSVAGGWDIAYLALQLFTLESGAVPAPLPWQLQAARFLAPAVATYAAARALALLFAERLERVRIWFARRHVVICGLGQKGLVLARSLRRRGERVVVIEEDAENDLIAAARASGVLVLVGDARDPQVLRTARVPRADHLLGVTGADGDNAAIAVHARALSDPDRSRPLRCLVHVVDPRLCDLLHLHELSRPGDDGFRLDFFNIYQSGARALLQEHPVPAPAPGDGQNTATRVVVVGLGRFGESLLLQLARERATDLDLTVVVVDRAAGELATTVKLRHPWLRAVCTLEPWSLDVESPEFTRGEFLFAGPDGDAPAAAYVCIDDEPAGLVAGLTLQRHLKETGAPVVVRMAHGTGLAALLGAQTGGTVFEGLNAFGLLDRLWNPDLLSAGAYERIARAMHGEYVRQRREATGPEEEADDPALRPWEELSEELRESNRAQAAHLGTKLDAVDCELTPLTDPDAADFAFTPDEVDRLARLEHQRWWTDRQRQGWTSGSRNPDALTSPYLVPWEKLDEDARERDRNFIRELPTFLASVGFQIVRR